MADKKLYDNLYKVIKANSGPFTANDTVKTEILDLQIPRGFGARIRRVIFRDYNLKDQLDEVNFRFEGCLVLDPDDEDSYQIPSFRVDHDVLCDFEFHYQRFIELTGDGISFMNTKEVVYDFNEEMDVITVRNPRFNALGNGLKVDGDYPAQCHIEVYFTYEKIPMELYEKLLGIS